MSEVDDYFEISQLVENGSLTDKIYEEVFPRVVEREGTLYGKKYKVPRWSVLIGDVVESAVIKDRQIVKWEKTCDNEGMRLDNKKGRVNYGSLPVISWDLTPSIQKLKEMIEEQFPEIKIKLCLAHVYNDGHHYVSWHSDGEATNPPRSVFSVSFGTPRKFRVRKIGQTRGWDAEYNLEDGMMVHMKAGCQEIYQHGVPKQTRVKTWRINLTFRY